MDIIVTGRSALTLQRALRERRAPLKARDVPTSSVRPGKLTAATFRSLNLGVLQQYQMGTVQDPVEIAVVSAAERVWIDEVVCHVRTTALPGGSYQQLLPTRLGYQLFPQLSECRILIDSVPLVLATQAGVLHDLVRSGRMTRNDAIVALARLMCEFAGTYVRDASDPLHGEVTFEVPPATSMDEVRAYLAQLTGVRGIGLARAAARLACDGLASPMELVIFAGLTFPPRLGGLSIKDVMVNKPLDLSEAELANLGIQRLTPDFRIEDVPVMLEYQGEEHLKKYRVRKDKNRAQYYAKLNLVHYPMMIDDVRTVSAFDRTLRDIVDLLSPYLGGAFRTRVLHILHDEGYRKARAHLLELYLPKGDATAAA